MVSILVQVRHLRAIGVVLGSCGRAPQAKQLLLAPSRQAHTPPSRNTGASAASESHNTMSAPATNYEAKQAARKQVKEALKGLSVETMAKESNDIAARVLASSYFRTAGNVGVYLHCARLKEVDTTKILEASLQNGKRCYVPVVVDKQSNMKLLHLDDPSCLVSVPPFGILEPPATYANGSPREDALESQAVMDVLLMPGLGFDTSGQRLGRGGGYYDKMLSSLKAASLADPRRPVPLLVALAYSAQIVGQVPVDTHDEPVDIVVTATAAHACSERGARALHR